MILRFLFKDGVQFLHFFLLTLSNQFFFKSFKINILFKQRLINLRANIKLHPLRKKSKNLTKGQTKSKRFFLANISSKKRKNKFNFTTMIPQVDFFSFGFWRKLKIPKLYFKIDWPLEIKPFLCYLCSKWQK